MRSDAYVGGSTHGSSRVEPHGGALPHGASGSSAHEALTVQMPGWTAEWALCKFQYVDRQS